VKRRILALGIVLALVAALAVPMTVLAADTEVTGTWTKSVTLTAPSAIHLGEMVQGNNTGNSTGSVLSNVDDWTLTVTASDGGFMKSGNSTLTTPLGIGMTEGTNNGNITSYNTELEGVETYGDIGTFAIPLYVKQVIVPADASGTYSITLTYTVTPP
jgi:hypothetical protein